MLKHDAGTWSCKAFTTSTAVSYMLHLCHSASAGSLFLPPKASSRNTSLCWKQRRATQPSHDTPHCSAACRRALSTKTVLRWRAPGELTIPRMRPSL